MAGYSFDNPYNTGYGAQGGGDGGGFMQGEVTSSPAGGKVGSSSENSHVHHNIDADLMLLITRETTGETLCVLSPSSRSSTQKSHIPMQVIKSIK
jgi:hypothetical protein